MNLRVRLSLLGMGVFAGMTAATQYTAWLFRWPALFGSAWSVGDVRLYAPWSFLTWWRQFGSQYPHVWTAGFGLILFGLALGGGLSALLGENSTRLRRTRGWGALADAHKAGLLNDSGCVLGSLGRRLLTTDDLRPTLVTGGTRSGKGRGHIVPSLLAWTQSVLVHDPKGELWRLTAGWRAAFSHTAYINPRSPFSARFNPLAEVQLGSNEIADVQRIVAILADPGGTKDEEAIWDKAASEILEAVILHVLYTAEDDAKTLITVVRLLADLDATVEIMLKTLHRKGPDGAPQTHPFIERAVNGYGSMHDRFRTSVQGTARSYLKWLAGEDVERTLSGSDVCMGDLMCAKAPMSLYIQVGPADQQALKPLVRLLFYAAAQALTVHETTDAAGREKAHRLLMVMDEFPLLGRLEFFQKSLRLLSGYGVKAMFAAQSLNDIVETYGPNNTILDNCFVYTAFAALDPLTQEKVSKLTGSVDETRESLSGPTGLSAGRSSRSRSTVDRPLLEPGEIRALGDDEQLMFVAGRKPFRTKKVRYDQRKPFRQRAAIVAPDQATKVDVAGPPRHLWAGVRAAGIDQTRKTGLFPEQKLMIAAKEMKDTEARLARREREENGTLMDMMER